MIIARGILILEDIKQGGDKMDSYSGLELMFLISVVMFVIGIFFGIYMIMRIIYKNTRDLFKNNKKKRGKNNE